MSELPADWAATTLGEVADFVMGQAPPGAACNFDGVGTPFVKAGEFGAERPAIREWTTKPLKMACSTDVLICVVGATCGKLNLGADCAIGRSVAAIRPNPGLEQHYLYALLKPLVLSLRHGATGSAQGVISKDRLAEIDVPLPPLAEQRRIVAKLDALTARTARARADLDRIPALAARYKQAVLSRAFSGELTADWRAAQPALEPISPRSENDIRPKYRLGGAAPDFAPPYAVPESWRWLRLPQLGDMDRGKSRHRPRDDARLFDGPFPFVQTGEVRAADRYLTSYSKTYSAFGLEQSKLWPIGTVCITIAANIAETAILGIEACFPDSVVGFNADAARCLPDYVEYFIRTAKADLEQFAPATAQKNINLEVLGSIRLPVASLHEQAEIVRRIDRAFAEIDRLTAEAAAARRLLDRLDQAVLAKAFRGELVPQDPADEPASVLLDRIRAERAAAPKAKRGRRPALA